MEKPHAWIDIDDTIMANHHLYQHAKAKAAMALMEIDRYLNNVSEIVGTIDDVDKEKIRSMGLSMKRFPQSVLEGVLKYAQQRGRMIPQKYHRRFVEIGEDVFSSSNYISLLPGSQDVLERLASDFNLMFVTEGDLVAQNRKVQALLLGVYGPTTILPRKSIATLSELISNHQVNPKNAIFIGNSLRSDIIPSASLGFATVYIPYESWNAHHLPGDVVAPKGPRHFEFAEISQVLIEYDKIKASVK